MSVPLPSPSTIPSTSARTIPRSRPTPISLDPVNEPLRSPASPGQSPSRPGIKGTGSRDRRGSRSGVGTPGLGQSPGNDINWRERTLGTAAATQGTKNKAPERTVGGFGKKEVVTPTSATGAGNGGGISGSLSASDAKKLSSAEKTAALAHVPCRFYKAGTCTAGDSCPFSHGGGGKKEVCQWFLKGNCKFGHKCALIHVRPGEPISMDRKNKKAAQAESKGDKPVPSPAATPTTDDTPAAPVAIRSALSSSLQTPPTSASPRASASSPMREPIGPPSGLTSAPSGGFGRSPGAFGASPNRPSPLSSSFSSRLAVPGPLALKGSPTTAIAPSRQPATAGPSSGFSASLSHSSNMSEHARPPLSASLADGSYLRRSIWAHSEKADEPLSPRRPITTSISRSHPDVFDEDDDNHGEDLLPSSLSDLLTPIERARRMSRRDSNDYFGASPARSGSLIAPHPWVGERLAQSAGAMGPTGFLGDLWSPGGKDARHSGNNGNGSEFTFEPAPTAQPQRQSLLSEQLSPISPPPRQAFPLATNRPAVSAKGRSGDVDLTSHLIPPFFSRVADPSSPSAKALSEHTPGMSLPGGVPMALSRLHLGEARTGLTHGGPVNERVEESSEDGADHKGEEREETMFTMDG